jgi:hypothetical protein
MANEKTTQFYCDTHPVIQASRRVLDEDECPVYMCKTCYLKHLMRDVPAKQDDFEEYQHNFWSATSHQPLFE